MSRGFYTKIDYARNAALLVGKKEWHLKYEGLGGRSSFAAGQPFPKTKNPAFCTLAFFWSSGHLVRVVPSCKRLNAHPRYLVVNAFGGAIEDQGQAENSTSVFPIKPKIPIGCSEASRSKLKYINGSCALNKKRC